MKIGIIGLGWVGTSVAHATLQTGVASEVLLNDLRADLAEGEAMDLRHGSSFFPGSVRIAAAAIEDMRDADAVVIAAGRGGKPGETRLELSRDNARVVRELAGRLAGLRGILVLVTNPVDLMTEVATEASGLPPARVLGTGTLLDTTRLRQVLARELAVSSHSIHAQVVGEHGDSEVVLWSSARVGNRALRGWQGWRPDDEARLADEVRCAAYEIIRRKGATNHAIGVVTAALLEWSLRDERRLLTVSRLQEGACGLRGVALSLPAVVGKEGAVRVVEPELDAREREALERSASVLREARRACL